MVRSQSTDVEGDWGGRRMDGQRADERQRIRFELLESGVSLGNVAEACRRFGISRTQYYTFRKRYELKGIDGLRDLPRSPKSHPQTTPACIANRILSLSLANPTWGCVRIERELAASRVFVSSPTIQKILIRNHLASISDRLLFLELGFLNEHRALSTDQLAEIEKANPSFRERLHETACPGELLCQTVIHTGTIRGLRNAHLQLLVDTWSGYGFAGLFANMRRDSSISIVRDQVIPQFKHWGIPVQAIELTQSRHFEGKRGAKYEQFTTHHGIDVRHPSADHPLMNGFLARFRQIVVDEFLFPIRQQGTAYTNDSAREALAGWLERFNQKRRLEGYRNLGKPPFERIQDFLATRRI